MKLRDRRRYARDAAFLKGVPSKRRASFATYLWRIGLLIFVYAAIVILLVMSISPKRYNLRIGDVASDNIIATRDVEDKISTEELRTSARQNVKQVYRIDSAKTTAVLKNVNETFSKIMMTIQQGIEWKAQNTPLSTAQHPNPTPKPFSKDFLDEANKNINIDIDQPLLLWLLSAKEDRIQNLKNIVYKTVGESMTDGVLENQIDATVQRIAADLQNPLFALEQQETWLAAKIVSRCVTYNKMPDAQGTLLAQQRAADAVSSVMLRKGQNIVLSGDVLTASQIDMLNTLGLLQENAISWYLYAGGALLTLIQLLLICAYLFLYEPDVVRQPRQAMLLSIIYALCVLLAFGVMKISVVISVSAVIFGVLLVACLLHSRLAIIVGLMLSQQVALMAGGAEGLFSPEMFVLCIAGVFASMTGVFILNKQVQRFKVFQSGLGMGTAVMLTYLAAGVLSTSNYQQVLLQAAIGFGGGVLAGAVALGTLPVWENIFDVVTPMKLMDISNPNHPLLKRLLTEAPGTYSHSVTVANMTERACEAIDANGLLARVGAFYHDVGKLRRPTYFVENLMERENPHDQLAAEVSSKIVASHPTDGVILAKRHHLPRDIMDIIQQHHGTSVIRYFYSKAKEKAQAEGGVVDIKLFRHVGPKPQTKEAAIIMLADSAEAAVKSLKHPTREEVEDRVRTSIKDKLQDGQLDDCHLSLRELERVALAFTSSLRGFYHERIDYPKSTDQENHIQGASHDH